MQKWTIFVIRAPDVEPCAPRSLLSSRCFDYWIPGDVQVSPQLWHLR
jgi:hypothetical protein